MNKKMKSDRKFRLEKFILINISSCIHTHTNSFSVFSQMNPKKRLQQTFYVEKRKKKKPNDEIIMATRFIRIIFILSDCRLHFVLEENEKKNIMIELNEINNDNALNRRKKNKNCN